MRVTGKGAVALVAVATALGWYVGVASRAQPRAPAPIAGASLSAAAAARPSLSRNADAALQGMLAQNRDLRAEVEHLETALSVSHPAGGGVAQEGAPLLPVTPQQAKPLGINGEPLYLSPATSHAEFCALIPATAKQSYAK